jgi:2-polyprenyl-6-hydroxyphenyl methylase / 3-demethylubiquinone-9 3-methyltransferase
VNQQTTIDEQEVAKFAQHSSTWWDKNGPFKTLHDINPVRLDFIQKFTTLKGQRVLDLGCGGGVLTEALYANGACVTGLDVESKSIAIAQSHAEKNNLTIEYVCEAIENYQAEKFSIITCMEMLEHVADPALIIKHAKRLLRPGGYLFLSTINRTPKAYAAMIIAAEYVLKLLPRQTHDYKKFIQPSELASIARNEGLSLLEIKGLTYNPFSRKAELTTDVKINYLCVYKFDENILCTRQ